jgi:Chondroitin N-acetylgalactosaminyltransferase
MQTLFYHSAGGADERGVEIDPQKVNQRILSNAVTIHPIKQPANMELLGMRLKSNRRVSLLSVSQNLRFKNSLSSGSSSRNMSVVMLDNLDMLPPSEEPWSLIYNHYLYTIRAGGGQRVKISAHLYQAVLQVVWSYFHFFRVESQTDVILDLELNCVYHLDSIGLDSDPGLE